MSNTTIKQGYKQTEVGLIPEDWKVLTINDVATVIGGGTPSTFISEYWNGNINWFTPTEIGKNKYSYQSKRKITSLGLSNSSAQILPIGTILMSTRASIGDLSILSTEATTNQGFQSLIAKNDFYNEFLYYLVQNSKSKLIKNSSGSTFLEISPNKVKSIEIPVPPTLEEQKAIATALSDLDELITNLDKLITKKKAIKHGTMQQLLTPKENWTLTSLIELAENKKSNFDDGDWIESEFITDSGIRLIQTGNIGIGKYIEKGSKKYISEESFFKLRCKEVIIGDLLICRLAEPAGRACVMPNIGESKVITSVDVSIFRGDNKTVNREFLSQYFTTSKWFNQVLERVGGTTHKRISRGALGKLEIFLPNIEEQKNIAQILVDMDLEIEQLENKKTKYQNIKQGMMQELLTGKTRLI
jgi:type I restriction enzyme S subunit